MMRKPSIGMIFPPISNTAIATASPDLDLLLLCSAQFSASTADHVQALALTPNYRGLKKSIYVCVIECLSISTSWFATVIEVPTGKVRWSSSLDITRVFASSGGRCGSRGRAPWAGPYFWEKQGLKVVGFASLSLKAFCIVPLLPCDSLEA